MRQILVECFGLHKKIANWFIRNAVRHQAQTNWRPDLNLTCLKTARSIFYLIILMESDSNSVREDNYRKSTSKSVLSCGTTF